MFGSSGMGEARRIGIIVDHPQRDLPGACLLALALALRGIEGVLVPLYDQGVDVPLLGLDALVLNFARETNLPLARAYAQQGIALYVLDTEGGVMASTGRASPEAAARYIADSEWAELLTGHFFWGERLRDAFLEAGALPADALHLTGCPRFDLYHERFAHQPARSGHILVNTNFPLVNPRFVADAGERGDRRALEGMGQDAIYIDAQYDANAALMFDMLELVRSLAREHPERQFVLRPHPFEGKAIYVREFADMPNVAVEQEGPVIDALRGASALIHCNCSTAIEALMLGIPPVTPAWINPDFLVRHSPLPSEASVLCESREALSRAIARDFADARETLGSLYAEIAYPWFYRDDGMAAQRVADILNTEVRARASGPARSVRASLASGRAQPSLAQRAQGLAANAIGSRAAGALRAMRQRARLAKRFSPADASGILARQAEALGQAPPLVRRVRHPVHGALFAAMKVTAPPPDRGPAHRQP